MKIILPAFRKEIEKNLFLSDEKLFCAKSCMSAAAHK
jgi:hypothetical protein